MNIQRLVIPAFVILGLFLIPSIFGNATGGISGLIKTVGITGALITFLRPKFGIYIIALETCYLDFFKKLGTYYGVAAQITVLEILAMSMLTIGMLWLTMLLNVILTQRKLSKTQLFFFLGLCAYSVLILATGGVGVKSVQNVVNGAGIFGVIMAITLYYDDPKSQMFKYINFMIVILVPWAVLGFYQRYVDYSDMDYWYSYTKLSVTNKPLEVKTMIYGYRPPIGFGSSELAFGFMGSMYGLCLWCFLITKKHLRVPAWQRVFYFLTFVLFLTAILHTDHRTSMLAPIVIFGIYMVSKSRFLFKLSVALGVLMLLSLVIFSSYLSDNIVEFDTILKDLAFFIEDKRRITIQTLAARIKPLEAFTNLDNWSLIGVASLSEVTSAKFGDQYYSHNALATVFFTTGAAGLSILIVAGATLLSGVYKVLFMLKSPLEHTMVRYGVAYALIFLLLQVVIGSGYATQPANIVAILPIGLLVCASIDKRPKGVLSN